MAATQDYPSLRQQVGALEVHQSIALARRFELAEATAEALAETAERLHNHGRNAMARAKKDTGHTYTGEAGNFNTCHGMNPVIVFLITRTA